MKLGSEATATKKDVVEVVVSDVDVYWPRSWKGYRRHVL